MLRFMLVHEDRLFLDSLTAELRRLSMRGKGLPGLSKRASFATACDIETALRMMTHNPPDIVFMDTEFSHGDAFKAVRRMQRICPHCKIAFLTHHDYDVYIDKAIAANAAGYILSRDELTVLTRAIAAIVKGKTFFSESIRPRLRLENGCLQLLRPRNKGIAALSRREREILIHLGRGASLKDAAAAMNVSYKTADSHKASVMRKLDIHDRVELARFVIHERLVSSA